MSTAQHAFDRLAAVTAEPEFGGLLEPFIKQEMPGCLRPDAPIPEAWTGPAEEWATLAERGREAHRLKPYLEAALAVGERGLTPPEIISGRLLPGSAMNAVTGRVVRPLEPSISEDLVRQAQQAQEDLAAWAARIEPALESTLESAARGAWHGQQRSVEGAIQAARAAIRGKQSELAAAQAEKDAQMTMRVLRPFRAAGKSYAIGVSKVAPSEADAIRDAFEREKAEAERHGRTPAKEGVVWPPAVFQSPP